LSCRRLLKHPSKAMAHVPRDAVARRDIWTTLQKFDAIDSSKGQGEEKATACLNYIRRAKPILD
jgi:hypothetical protein